MLDAEVLLDGEHAVVHHLRWADFDPRALVSGLSRTFDAHVALFDLTRTGLSDAAEEEPDEARLRPAGVRQQAPAAAARKAAAAVPPAG